MNLADMRAARPDLMDRQTKWWDKGQVTERFMLRPCPAVLPPMPTGFAPITNLPDGLVGRHTDFAVVMTALYLENPDHPYWVRGRQYWCADVDRWNNRVWVGIDPDSGKWAIHRRHILTQMWGIPVW